MNKPLTSLQAIRKHCIEDCKGGIPGSMKAVRNCQNVTCFLYSRRFGHNPKITQGKGNYALKRERGTAGKFEKGKTRKRGEKKQAQMGNKTRIIEVSESVIISKEEWRKIEKKIGQGNNEKEKNANSDS